MNSRPRLDVFVEDRAHEYFVRALVMRVAREERKHLDIQVRSAVGGHGKAVDEFKKYQKLLEKGLVPAPSLIVVGIDANCAKFNAKRKEVRSAVSSTCRSIVVIACPDPHIERWYLSDSESFRRVVGSEPRIKQKKCERDYYKSALASAVRDAGHPPTLGGIEFAEELADNMDLYEAGKTDGSLRSFVDDLRLAVRRL